jgi:hypothetical protein
MSPAQAWRDGIRRVAGAPSIIVGVWLMTSFASLPLALSLRSDLTRHLGSSLAAETAASGANYEWMQEFTDQASGIGTTFRPTILGFGAVLDNLSAFADNTARPIVIVGAAGTYMVLWLFAAGGIIDRYARDRATGIHGFFSASGVFFFRFFEPDRDVRRLRPTLDTCTRGCSIACIRGWFDRSTSNARHSRSARDCTGVRPGPAFATGLRLHGPRRRRGSAQRWASSRGSGSNLGASVALYLLDLARYSGDARGSP